MHKHKSWLALWNTNAHGKAKIHMWRLIKNGLAVGAELHRRKIKPGIFCTVCGREETVLHRFWACPHSAMFWKVLSSEKGVPVAIPPVSDGPHGELASWLLRWFADAGDQERELMVQAAYGLWLARNEARDGKKIADPRVVAENVYQHIIEWTAIHTKQLRCSSPAPAVRWSLPEQGWLKANSDGALSKLRDRGGGGVVLRDHAGAFRGGACYVFRDVSDPEVAEILACCKALQLAIQAGATRVHVEVDSKGVAAMLNDQAKNLSAAGPIVEEIKLLGRSLQGFKASWVRRSGTKELIC